MRQNRRRTVIRVIVLFCFFCGAFVASESKAAPECPRQLLRYRFFSSSLLNTTQIQAVRGLKLVLHAKNPRAFSEFAFMGDSIEVADHLKHTLQEFSLVTRKLILSENVSRLELPDGYGNTPNLYGALGIGLVPRQISFSVCSWGFPTEDHPGIGKNLFDRALVGAVTGEKRVSLWSAIGTLAGTASSVAAPRRPADLLSIEIKPGIHDYRVYSQSNQAIRFSHDGKRVAVLLKGAKLDSWAVDTYDASTGERLERADWAWEIIGFVPGVGEKNKTAYITTQYSLRGLLNDKGLGVIVEGELVSLAWDPVHGYLLIGRKDGTIAVLDSQANWKQVATIQRPWGVRGIIDKMVVSPDGKSLAIRHNGMWASLLSNQPSFLVVRDYSLLREKLGLRTASPE